MSKLRHWKDHWDPTAKLEFRKRMKLGIEGHDYVNGGDPVTQKIIDGLGKHAQHRLKLWFEAGFVATRNFRAPDEVKAMREGRPAGTPIEPEHTGRGWYLVTGPDGKQHRVRNQEPAIRLRDELWGGQPNDLGLTVDGDELRQQLEASTAAPDLTVDRDALRASLETDAPGDQ